MNGSVPGVTLGAAFRFWLRLGFISFGGPAGQIAIMHRELVEQKGWISERRFLHALNYCMLLPGPEAQQLATYIGWLLHRTWGGVIAGVLFVLPSLFILIGLSWVYVAYGHVAWVAGLLYGIKPAVAAIVIHAVHRIGSRTLKRPAAAPALWGIAALSFIAIAFLKVPFPWLVLGAALCGWLGQRYGLTQFSPSSAHPAPVTGITATGIPPPGRQAHYVIDDDTPTPTHARYTRVRLARVVTIGALLWLVPVAALALWQGWNGAFPQMAWFFTKAALLTIGGAYAVLPYVYQGAVEQYTWLTAPQMMDGLALGESTPGPLIMVVTFVAFVGGWSKQVLGPDALFLGAATAAVLVTWFTFLPSFLFILAGGPLVESTHGKLHFTAPLTAITAAVVGVIASLALFFVQHIAWPEHSNILQWDRIDPVGLGLAAAATLALLRYKLGVIPVLGASAVAGLVLRLAVHV